MKKLSIISLKLVATVLFSILALSRPAAASVWYWDPEGSATATAANLAGTWTLTTAQFSTTSAQTASPVAWVNTNAVCFCAGTTAVSGAFTVSLTNTISCAGIFNGPFTPPGYNVTLGGTGAISLNAGQDGIEAGGSDGDPLIINLQLTGPGQAILEGSDQLYFNVSNSYTGGTQLGISGANFTSIVNFSNNAAFGTGPIQMFTSGAAMAAEGSSAFNLTNVVIATNGILNIVPGVGGTTFSGPWYLSNSPTIGAGSTAGQVLTIAGPISGATNFNKYNAGTLMLTGTNTYTGSTSNSGPLIIGGAGKLGSGSYSGAMTNNGTFTYASSASQTLSGIISGTGPLVESGSGTLALSGANTYTGGTTVSGGAISINGSDVTPFGAITGSVLFSGGNLIVSADRGTSTYNILNPIAIVANTEFQATTTTGTRNLTFGGSFTGTNGSLTLHDTESTNGPALFNFRLTNTFVFNPPITFLIDSASNTINFDIWNLTALGDQTYNGTISGPGSIKRSATTAGTGGRVLFNGTNTYYGGTSLNDGEIVLGSPSFGLPEAPTAGPVGTGPITINNNGGKLSASALGTNLFNHIAFGSGTQLTLKGSNNLTLSGNLDLNGTTATITNINSGVSTIAGIITNGNFTYQGTNTLILAGTNVYAGATTVSAGTLALGANGSISNSASVKIAAGATLDVSAISTFAFGGSTNLTASGTALPATINGASGGSVNLGTQSITLTYDGSHPALTIAQGTLALNGNNFIVNGSVLAPGTYTVVQQTSGSISSSGSFAVSGTAIGSGKTGAITVTGATVNLTIMVTPVFSGLSTSQTNYYGTNLTLSGTLSATGPLYPAAGETVTVTINGVAQSTTISDSTGDFTVIYNSSAIPASTNSYAITYSYAGDTTFNAANNSITALTVTPEPLSITATAQIKTYGQTVTFGSGSGNFTSSGLVNGETIGSVTLAVSGNGGASNAPVSGSPYVITPGAATGGTFNPANYAISYNPGALTISPAALTVTASAQTETYGQGLTFGSGSTNFTTSGLVNGEMIGSVTLAVSGGVGASNAPVSGSPYTITPSAATGGTFTAANYSITYSTGTLTITPAALTITASAQTAPYGQGVTFGGGSTNFTSSGLVNGETVGSVTLAVSGGGGASNAPVSGSPYTITPSAATGGTFTPANYSITYSPGTLTITPVALTITANPQTKTYGQTVIFGSGSTNFTTTGLANGDTIGSVTLAVSGGGGASNAPVSGSPYTITPSAATGGTFTAANYSITYSPGTLTITPAALIVTGDSFSRAFGATNPVFTVTYTNFVNGETLATSDVIGSPSLTTSATTNSDLGAYDITNSLGTLASTNYSFAFVDGTLLVTNALSTNVVSADTNPALPGTTVTFTAAVSALAPSFAVPTNAVQFLIDGNIFGGPVPLTNGIAQITNAALSHGYHVIEADYAGDTNVLGGTNISGSTNTLTELINTPPVAGTASFARQQDVTLQFNVSALLTNTTDADGDLITLVSVSPISTNGAAISLTNGVITYTPPATNGNVTDSFSYTVMDTYGATNTGTVLVTILPEGPVSISSGMTLSSGAFELNFTGTPGHTYLIQATTNFVPATWITISTNTADTNGLFQFIDTDATNYGARYYRTILP